jgi:two-component system phosphate regulon sensor histidine kinase PhoR
VSREGGKLARARTWILVTAIVVGAVILAVVTYRTTFQLEAMRAQAVFEATLGLADEKVDRVERAIIEADDAVMALGEGGHAGDIPRRFRTLARQTPSVAHVVVLSNARDVVAFSSRVASPADDAFRLLLLRRILPDLDLSTLPIAQIRHLHRAYDGAFFLLTYWRAQQVRSDGTLDERLVVLHHDRDAVARELLEQVVPFGAGGQAGVRVNVVDDEGRVVFGPPLSKSDLIVAKRFPTTLYAWRLQVAPTASGELAEKARRRRLLEMSLLGLSCVVVVAGVVALLLATFQERRLAQLRGEFVANVSHELKTPLALVRMFGELLMTGRVANEEKQRQYLSIIVRESERLTALIENVLDFARVERGKVAYDFAPADLSAVVARAVDACRYRAETEGMRLEVVNEDPTAPTLEAVIDERAVQLAVINLVENAIKYAPGTAVVRVELARDGTKDVAIKVIDHGPGIDPADYERIFERFYRGKRAADAQVRGSGIGLSLVEHVVDAHEGEVFVRETPGGGATFVIRLPVAGPAN